MASHHAINELVPTKVSHEKKRNQPKQVWLRNSKGETRSVRFQVFFIWDLCSYSIAEFGRRKHQPLAELGKRWEEGETRGIQK